MLVPGPLILSRLVPDWEGDNVIAVTTASMDYSLALAIIKSILRGIAKTRREKGGRLLKSTG